MEHSLRAPIFSPKSGFRWSEMKAEKKAIGVSQRHLYCRISYLYQAATHLMNASSEQGSGTIAATLENQLPGPTQSQSTDHFEHAQEMNVKTPKTNPSVSHSAMNQESAGVLGPSRHLISQLRSVSLKGQIRLSQAVKHSICKRCDALLVPGSTSSTRVENKSRGGRKPWADVLVITCHSCSAVKRFPVGAKRQPRRPHRASDKKPMEKDLKVTWMQTEIELACYQFASEQRRYRRILTMGYCEMSQTYYQMLLQLFEWSWWPWTTLTVL